jgi:hypothetical protein
MALTVTQMGQKWVTGMQNAQTTMTQGVAATTKNPGTAALQKVDFWASQVALAKPKYQAAMQRFDFAAWKTAMQNYGIQNSITGAQNKVAKYTTALQAYLTAAAGTIASIQQMPSGTLAAALQRSAAMITFSWNYRLGGG